MDVLGGIECREAERDDTNSTDEEGGR